MSQEHDQRPPRRRRRTVCFSLYQEDIELIGRMVEDLRSRGRSDMSKSEVIRMAIGRMAEVEDRRGT